MSLGPATRPLDRAPPTSKRALAQDVVSPTSGTATVPGTPEPYLDPLVNSAITWVSLGFCSQPPCDRTLPTSTWQPLHKAGPDIQLGRGPTKPTRLPMVASLSQQKDPRNHTGSTLGAYSDEKGVNSGMQRTFPSKSHFSKIRKFNEPTGYIEIRTS